jgi:hypothetical protein
VFIYVSKQKVENSIEELISTLLMAEGGIQLAGQSSEKKGQRKKI